MKQVLGAWKARALPAAVAVTAVAGLMAVAMPAQAQIVYSGPVNIDIPDNIDGVYFNLVTGIGSASAAAVPGWDINPYSALEGFFNLWGATTTTWLSPSGDIGGPYPLAAGTPIGAGGTFTRPGGGTNVGDQVTLDAPNLFGVRFANESTGGAINFAWVEITFGADAATRAITGYAYDNSGATILAGVVPEPGTYAMMLAGLAAVGGLAMRRRRAQSAE
jgi:hypothetical protein